MSELTSLYINILRILCSIGVVVFHSLILKIIPEKNFIFSSKYSFGHGLVVVFFVLSGYVIAFVHDNKTKNLREYIVDRISRVYSVLIPALFFTFLIDIILSTKYEINVFNVVYIFRYIIAFLSLQEIWFISSKIPSNGPLWSISYEFWYYIFFGFLVLTKSKTRVLCLIGIILLAGHKILLMMPVWMMGVLAYYISKKYTLNILSAIFIFSFSVIVILFLLYNDIVIQNGILNNNGMSPLYYSSNFLSDYILGLLVLINLISVNTFKIKINKVFTKIINRIAGSTFTLYLFHFPVLYFILMTQRNDFNALNFSYINLVLVIVSILICGIYIEGMRYWYKDLLTKLFLKFKL